MNEVDMKVRLGTLELASPVVTASGAFGYGTEYKGIVDYSKLGAVTAKGIRLEPWAGNEMPRHVEVPGGLVNAIGLQGVGLEAFVSSIIPWYRENTETPLIANIWGTSVDEYAAVAAGLGDAVDAIEMNVSCPNVKKGGHTFGHDPVVLSEVVSAVRAATRLPLFVKLAPNVPDIVPYAVACRRAGADALSLINTIPAMVIDVKTRRFALANRSGGLSGRCVHPVAVKLVYEASRAVDIPVLAMGGVYDWQDAVELMLAGASAVAVGTSLFTNPSVVAEVYDGIMEYCRTNAMSSVADLTGAVNAN